MFTSDAFRTCQHLPRQTRNVPHITAQNDVDAVAALGYLIAKSVCFQIDFKPAWHQGVLSEIFNATA